MNSDPLGVRIKAMVERYNRRASQDLTTDMTYWVLLYGREFGINPALVAALIAGNRASIQTRFHLPERRGWVS